MRMVSEAEAYYDELKVHNNSLYTIVPYKIVMANGWKKGDKIKVLIKKVKHIGK